MSKRKPTSDEFIAAYCHRSGVTWDWLKQYRHVVPCDCGDELCEGWAMVPLEFENSQRPTTTVKVANLAESTIEIEQPCQ